MADKQYIYFINHKQTGVVKVDIKSYSREQIPLEGDKIFHIAIGGNRLYAIGEDGSLQVAFRSDDPLQPLAPTKQKTESKGRDKPAKDAEVSDDDIDSAEDRPSAGQQLQIKAIKIPDIEHQDHREQELHNQSIIMGSEPEDDEPEELPTHSASSTRAKSALQSILTDIDKPRTHL